MFSRILVGLDDSEAAQTALAFGARLAREHAGTLVLCHAVNWSATIAAAASTGAIIDPIPVVDDLREGSRQLLAEASVKVHALGLEARTIDLPKERPRTNSSPRRWPNGAR